MDFTLVRPNAHHSSWRVRGHTLAGALIERSTGCTREAQAKAWLKTHKMALLATAARPERLNQSAAPAAAPAAEPDSFAAWVDAYALTRGLDLDWGKDPDQRHEIKRLLRLRTALGATPVAAVGPFELVQLARQSLPGRSNATLNREVLVPATAVLNLAADNGKRARAKTHRLDEPAPGLRRLVPADEARLLAAARPVFEQWLLLLWLFRTGLRIEDTLLRVVWPDASQPGERVGIDLEQRTVTLRIGKTANKRPAVTLHLADELVEALQQIAPEKRHGRLFRWGNQSNVNVWLHPLRARCGVFFTPHMARHTVGARLAEANEPLPVIQAVLQHRSVSSSLRYQSVTAGKIAAAVNRLGAGIAVPGDARRA